MGETNEFPDDSSSSTTTTTTLGELSRSSKGTSCSPSDLADDASSSPTNTMTFSPNSSSNECDHGEGGPLCELSELMTYLPTKRGLSRHYVGKSQSFASLASVRSLEDLMKENPCTKRMKVCSRRITSFGQNMATKAAVSEKRSSFIGTTTSSFSLGKICSSINNSLQFQ